MRRGLVPAWIATGALMVIGVIVLVVTEIWHDPMVRMKSEFGGYYTDDPMDFGKTALVLAILTVVWIAGGFMLQNFFGWKEDE